MSSTETMGIIAGALALVVAVTLLVGLKKYLDTIDGTVFVALLLLPLIVYAVGSGRLEQFSAPGGWGATFRDTANATVRTQNIIEEAEKLQAVEKGGLSNLNSFVENLDRNFPNAMVLRVGKSGYYQPNAILSYLRTLMAVGPSTYVVFVEQASGKFIASANGTQILAVIESGGEVTSRFMEELGRGGSNALREHSFLVRTALEPTDNNKTALGKFLDSNAQALVVVSKDGQIPTGVVDRGRLITKLLLELASGD